MLTEPLPLRLPLQLPDAAQPDALLLLQERVLLLPVIRDAGDALIETDGAGGTAVNSAVTVRAALIVTVHVEVPEHPDPVQPVNVEPAAGAAVNVTADPSTKLSEQSEPQSIPAGDEVTVPPPAPDFETVKSKLADAVGVTALLASEGGDVPCGFVAVTVAV